MKNIKTNYNRFRELWAVPKYKNRFKLGGWIIFFFILFLLFNLTPTPGPINDSNLNEEDIRALSFNHMANNLLENDLEIEYLITGSREYFIEAALIDNVINGILDLEETYRIKINHEEAFVIRNRNEEETNLLDELNLSFLFPSLILDFIGGSTSTMRNIEGIRRFTYIIDDITISFEATDEKIYLISITDDEIKYELKINIIE